MFAFASFFISFYIHCFSFSLSQFDPSPFSDPSTTWASCTSAAFFTMPVHFPISLPSSSRLCVCVCVCEYAFIMPLPFRCQATSLSPHSPTHSHTHPPSLISINHSPRFQVSCIFIELGIQGVEILQDMQALELLDLRQELLAALELCVCVRMEGGGIV